MENEIIAKPQREVNLSLSVDSIVHQREKIKEIQSRIMRENIDFGNVPGCPKPSLFKSGAEKLCSTFMLAVEPHVEDLGDSDEKKYRVTVRLTHQATGVFLGAGIGEASTNEDKFMWREAICDDEFNATEPEKKRVKYKKTKQGIITVNQVRTNPADLANTVLKMAKKRAQIDGVLTVLGASDFFTQDVEDMPAEYFASNIPPKPSMPKPTTKSGENILLTCFVSKMFDKKNPKAPQSFGLTDEDGNIIAGYFQTRDEKIISDMESFIESGEVVNLKYHSEKNGAYTNLIIDDVSAIIDNADDKVDRNADEKDEQ